MQNINLDNSSGNSSSANTDGGMKFWECILELKRNKVHISKT